MGKHDLTWDDVKKLSPEARRQVSEQTGGPPTSKPRPPSAPPAEPRQTTRERWRETVPVIKPMPRVPSTPHESPHVFPGVEIHIDDDEPRVGNVAFTIMMVGLLVMAAPFVLWILSALLHWAWMTS